MNPERWEKINHLFHVVIEIDKSERNDFLSKVCRNDQELLRELERLVAWHEEAQDFIQTPALLDPEDDLYPEETSLIGQQFGVYQIIKEIGRGGMGAVYLDERTNGEFKKSVAIKIIKHGMDTESVLRRFRNERQILATLEHPNIARLLDGGTTDDDLPYFVMELVEGLPITEFAETQQLSINERLELFRQVCSAITFAHQRLIVHRDLKPSNILVNEECIPKLLDFGIAKLMLTDGIGAEMVPTATGMRLMTPEYASPEQIQGLPVTTLSDIYSLGVILYELLSGHSPYQFKEASLLEMANIINTEEPLKPSERAAATSRNSNYPKSQIPNPKSLRGDLDTIVLKALRKEPEQRYNSVVQLSDDIRRHLDGFPVMARPITFSYRLAKFAGRNKLAVGFAVVIFLTLIGGIIATIWQAEAGDDPSLQLELAMAYEHIGDLRSESGFSQPDEMNRAIENYQKAAKIREDLLSLNPKNYQIRRETAPNYLKLAVLLIDKGDFKNALENNRRALQIFESLAAENPADSELLSQLARCYGLQGKILSQLGQDEASLEYFQKETKIHDSLRKN